MPGSMLTSGSQILNKHPKLWMDAKKFWERMTMPVLGSMLNAFLQTASRFSPPGKKHHLGKAVIPDQMYYCRIINIDAAAKQKTRIKNIFKRVNNMEPIPDDVLNPSFQGRFVKKRWIKGAGRGKASRGGKKGKYIYAVDDKKKQIKVDVNSKVKNINRGNDEIPLYKEDYAALRAGKRYKVVSTKWKQKNQTLGYASTLSQARKMARILNRGLAKYSWGTLLNNMAGNQTSKVGIQQTIEAHKTFKTLVRKSPNIAKYSWGSMYVDTSDIQNWNFNVTATYRMNTDQPYVPLAIKRGIYEAKKRWKAMMNAVWTKNKKSIERLMADQIRIVVRNK